MSEMVNSSAAFRLPAGVADAVLNKDQLARALGTSVNTVDRWLADGMPVLEVGTHGRGYKFQLSECWEWRKRKEADRESADAEAEHTVRQMRLALIGGDGDDEERSLPPKERMALYEAERLWQILARERGELIPAEEVLDLLEGVFATIRAIVSAMPDRLARDAGLTGAQTEFAIQIGDDLLAEARDRMRAFGERKAEALAERVLQRVTA